MALKKVECTDARTISLLREEDINQLLGQNELTLGQARLLSVAVHKLTLHATFPLPAENESDARHPEPTQNLPLFLQHKAGIHLNPCSVDLNAFQTGPR